MGIALLRRPVHPGKNSSQGHSPHGRGRLPLHFLPSPQSGAPVKDASGQVYRMAGLAEDITEKKQTGDALRESEAALRFLAEASGTLAAVVDYASTLRKVARLAVPFFADWCVVDMVEPDGSLRRLAVAHADPEKVQLADELQQR